MFERLCVGGPFFRGQRTLNLKDFFPFFYGPLSFLSLLSFPALGRGLGREVTGWFFKGPTPPTV